MISYYDQEPEYLATEGEADREYALNVGRDNANRAWILSDRDVWYPNPFYQGEPQPHPEDLTPEGDEGFQEWIARQPTEEQTDCPF